MRYPAWSTVVLGLAALALCGAAPAEPATVSAVQEGDVLAITRGGETMEVRLYGVDCPDPGQPGAAESAAFCREQVAGKEVEVEELTTDSQGKAVVRVTYGENKDLAEQLAAAGLAWWDQRNAPKAPAIKKLAAQAIVAQKGIWKEAAPLAPWDYRRSEDIESFTYSVEPKEQPVAVAEAAPQPEEESEEAKDLKLKGDAQYTGNKGPLLNFDNIDVNPNDLMLKHMPRIAKDDSGQALGFTASDIGSLPYAAEVGLQDGDIITSVNGNPIRSEADAFALVNRLKNQKNFSVDILRNGQPVNINFRIP